ncbi:MAG: hypothetical protein IPK46_04140 [Saprospiraceae bacterium]|nr:hypothetical protein [Saprospiraceae bacterium]
MILFLFIFWTFSCKQSSTKTTDLIYLIENPDLNAEKIKPLSENAITAALLGFTLFSEHKNFNTLKKRDCKQQQKHHLNEEESSIINIGWQN